MASAAAAQKSPQFVYLCRTVQTLAHRRRKFASKWDIIRLGVQAGEIKLQQLLLLSYEERRSIATRGTSIDVYLGETRVYKRVSRALIFACCPDVGRFPEPMCSRFVIRLPQSFSKALSVKLAILFMEQYLINPGV
jgi:hypothetical protein